MGNCTLEKLSYRPGDRFAPIAGVQTVTAKRFLHVDDSNNVHLEGLNFDRERNMYFCNIYESKIMKVDMQTKEMSVFYEFEDKLFKPAAVKIHKDGRFFVCGVDSRKDNYGEHGGICVLDPDGNGFSKIVSGISVNDMVFDGEGGIYFDNYQGTPKNPTGSIEYLSADLSERHTVIGNMASPNGIALSTDGRILWVTEINSGVLNRITLENQNYSTTPYKFEGFYGPDSASVDEDDNLYVAMGRQGRILVFNPGGFLIGQVLTPRRDMGSNLGTTHPMVHPDRAELYFTVHDLNTAEGANIYYCGSYAKGNSKAYQYA